MKTTRRQFLKSLIATAATAAITPQVLVESVHGASDLSAHERDVVADAMGLRSKQWRGLIVGRTSEALRRLGKAVQDTGHSFDALKRQLPFEHVNCRCVQVPVLVPGDSLFSAVELDVSDQEPLTAERVQSAFVRLCAERAVERDQQILWGRPGGQMPVGVLGADEIDEIWKHSDEERPDEPEHDHRGGYLIPEQYREKLLRDMIDGRQVVGKAVSIPMRGISPVERFVRASWDDNMYDNEPKALHLRFDEEEIVWRSRELEPDPDQKSPFFV